MTNAQVVRLKDVCLKIGSGATPRGGKEAYKGGLTSLIRSQNVYNDRFSRDGLVYIDEKQAAELSNVELRTDDVLLNITGDSVARCCKVAKDILPARVNQHVAILRTNPTRLDPDYLRYTLVTHEYQAMLLALASAGATRPALTKTMIEELKVRLPPLAEQKRIASILGALDDKIELNRRMNAKLEDMARTLFKSWFVDFDPVRAKLDGRLPAGMDANTAALFPDAFEESALGLIPKGWKVLPVGDVVECVGGSTPSTAVPSYWEGGTHHWTTPKDFSTLQSPILLDTSRKITDSGLKQISSGLLPAGTLLMSSRAPVGYLAISVMPIAINQGFIAMKSNAKASNYFMLNWCQTNMLEIEVRATGTTFPEISKQNFRPILLLLPSMEVVASFTAKVKPLYEQITINLNQAQTLSKLRDSLIPMLLNR